MKCFYHESDLDGKCSGAIVKKKYPKCDMIGIQYGYSFPWHTIDKDDTVVLVDFCLQPFEHMIRLNEMCNLIWIDHHESAVKDMHRYRFVPSGGGVVRDDKRAACELAWEFFYPDKQIPYPVLLISAYDTVQSDLYEGCAEFEYGMKVYNTDPGSTVWKHILSDNYAKVGKIIKEGKRVLEYYKIAAASYAKESAFDLHFEGLRCVAINTHTKGASEFESVYDADKHDAMLRFSYRDGFWSFSLYCLKPGIDTLSVSMKYGGGGHSTASGFQCSQLPFSVS
jgi:oligoribonuclease NrnB/cAMP/cGMP phosphodiesterase (DHH superfamily)